jgi:hypothetical protein
VSHASGKVRPGRSNLLRHRLGKPLPADVRKHLTTDPYLDAGTYDRYYGGLKSMMPWAAVTR